MRPFAGIDPEKLPVLAALAAAGGFSLLLADGDDLVAVLARAFGEREQSPMMEPEEREALLADWANPDAAIAMLNWYRASPMEVLPMDAPYALPDGWKPFPIPQLTIPTLVIWALDDHALPPENLEGMDAIIDDLTVVKVPDCGHFVPWEAPAPVNAALDDFLARTD